MACGTGVAPLLSLKSDLKVELFVTLASGNLGRTLRLLARVDAAASLALFLGLALAVLLISP